MLDKLASNAQATITDLIVDIKNERGRGFASGKEAWAEIKEKLEAITKPAKDADKLMKEMWESIKNREEEAFCVILQEMERTAKQATMMWAIVSAMAKLALISETGEDDGEER